MSTSLIYHGFGIKGYHYLKTEYREGAVLFHLEKRSEDRYCADCMSREIIKKGQYERKIKTLPIGKKKVFLVVHLHRIECQSCGSLKLEPLLLAFPMKQWAKNLGRYIVDLLKHTTVQDVAKHLGMSWDTVKEIHVWALKKRFKKRRMKHLKYLGVDEISVKKGHNYLTVVVDLETGQVVWVAKDRTAASLEEFFKKLKRARACIAAIAMDMWPAYIRAALNYYPYDVIVFDRYHIISDYNKMLDELRRTEAQNAEKTEKNVYVGVRYLLLKGEEKIENETKAKAKLNRLLDLNQTLNTAYVLKEELRNLWSCTNRQKAEEYLNNWLKKARSSGVRLIQKFANTLASHRIGVLNYFDHPITTSMVEGINNKIKVLKRQAYGFRDIEYFKLRIYSLHESRYAIIG